MQLFSPRLYFQHLIYSQLPNVFNPFLNSKVNLGVISYLTLKEVHYTHYTLLDQNIASFS